MMANVGRNMQFLSFSNKHQLLCYRLITAPIKELLVFYKYCACILS